MINRTLPHNFDWKYYYEANPDIAKGLRPNNKKNAENHWLKYGYKENRIYSKNQPSNNPKIINNSTQKTIIKNNLTSISLNKEKKITIIIPNKFGESPIVTINSLYKQTIQNFDIIIINDFDGNANIARNKGLKFVDTEYVLFSDNDIEWEPNAIELMFNELENNKDISLVYGYFINNERLEGNYDWNINKLYTVNYISTMTMVRTKDHPGFDENLKRLQDWDVWITMTKNGKVGKYINNKMFSTKYRKGITFGNNFSYGDAKNFILQKHFNKNINYDINLIITTYNRYDMLKQLLNDIQNYKKNYNIQITITDDGSDDDYTDLLFDNNIKYIKYEKNNGKENYWKLYNNIFKYLKNINSKLMKEIM